jgi:hypothetical protein
MRAPEHGNPAIHGDAGAFDASTQTVEGQAGADRQAPAGEQRDAARSAASATAGLAENFDVWEAL